MTLLVSLLIASILRLIPIGMLLKYLWQFRHLHDGDLGQVRRIIFYVALATFFCAFQFLVAVLLAMTEFKPSNPEPYAWILFGIPTAILSAVDWWTYFKVRSIAQRRADAGLSE